MRLYLIRHAESENNVLYQGDENMVGRVPDPEITLTGHKQADLLGRHMAEDVSEPRQHPFESSGRMHYGLTHIYCSLMTRSILTAQYISTTLKLTAEAVPDIFERKGVYDLDVEGNEIGAPGQSRAYFDQRFPGLILPETLGDSGWYNREVESDSEFVDRVVSSLDNIQQKHADSDDVVAMVVHGDYIDQCINTLMGVERKPHNYNNAWVANWVFHNTSISCIDIIGESRNVVYLNRIDHLASKLVTW
jgi:2,3-bisphosphoglycerate-dependent phosphoglycerate mutase